MNIRQPKIIKEHELQKPTFEWCPECGVWQIIHVQGFHICQPKNPKPTTPWRNTDDRLDDRKLSDN